MDEEGEEEGADLKDERVEEEMDEKKWIDGRQKRSPWVPFASDRFTGILNSSDNKMLEDERTLSLSK